METDSIKLASRFVGSCLKGRTLIESHMWPPTAAGIRSFLVIMVSTANVEVFVMIQLFQKILTILGKNGRLLNCG